MILFYSQFFFISLLLDIVVAFLSSFAWLLTEQWMQHCQQQLTIVVLWFKAIAWFFSHLFTGFVVAIFLYYILLLLSECFKRRTKLSENSVSHSDFRHLTDIFCCSSSRLMSLKEHFKSFAQKLTNPKKIVVKLYTFYNEPNNFELHIIAAHTHTLNCLVFEWIFSSIFSVNPLPCNIKLCMPSEFATFLYTIYLC